MIKNSEERSDHHIKCGVCRREIVNKEQIYQVGISLVTICGGCHEKFPPEDLEMMTNMFIGYGGYFGMLEVADFSFIGVLEEFLEEFLDEGKTANSEQLNIKLMHRALLHGISAQEYVNNLNHLVHE